MSDDNQLRKDVDKLLKFAEDISNDLDNKSMKEYLSEYFDLEEIEDYINHLYTLSNDLYDLQSSLIEFNSALINFSDDNTNFERNLKKLKENLNKVLSQINDIKEGSSEFSDVLDDFNIDITTFVETLWGLNSDLGILSECLDAFMDDLDGFEDALEEAGIDTTAINEDYAKLVWAVGNVRTRTDTAEGQIDDLLVDIGDDTNFDPEHDTPTGIKQWIAWLQYTIGSDEEGEETGLIASILELSNLIGTENDSKDDDTIFGNIAKANYDMDVIDGLINGDNNHVGILNQINTINNNDIPQIIEYIYGKPNGSSSDYTSDSMWAKILKLRDETSNLNYNISSLLSPKAPLTYVYYTGHTGTPTSDDNTIITSLGTDLAISNIIYACGSDGTYYKKTNNVWSSYNGYPTNVVAIGTDFVFQGSGQSLNKTYWMGNWSYLYDYVSMTYYKEYDDPNNSALGYYGEWVKCDGIEDSFENTKLYDIIESLFSKLNHTHSGYASSSHTHGNISNDGKVGSNSGKPLVTTTGGLVATGEFGSSSGQFAEGDHTHNGYASSSHNHDNSYSPIGHNHDTLYSAIGHNHDTDYAPLSHNHNTWTNGGNVSSKSNCTATLSYNSAIRLAHLHYVKTTTDSYSVTSSTSHTLDDTITLPSGVAPSTTVIGNILNPRLSIRMETTGTLKLECMSATSGTITADIWWHY